MKPLSENLPHLQQICELFGLGTPKGKLQRVAGGFHHCMWQLTTEHGRFAVKQLADDMDMGDAATVTQINATEITACEFSNHGVPALYSLIIDTPRRRKQDSVTAELRQQGLRTIPRRGTRKQLCTSPMDPQTLKTGSVVQRMCVGSPAPLSPLS